MTTRMGRVTKIVSLQRVDVQFPPDLGHPDRYRVLKILDNKGKVLSTVTVWKDRSSGRLWEEGGDEGWVRCWGPTESLSAYPDPSEFRVIETTRIDYRAKYFDKLLSGATEFLRSKNLPHSDLEHLDKRPPLQDTKLSERLTEILDGVVRLGYKVAMIATYVEWEGQDELVLRIIRNRPGNDWQWEWGEDFVGARSAGWTLKLRDHAHNIAAKAVERAIQQKPDAYAVTHNLYDLWNIAYTDPRDEWLVRSYQFLAGIMSMITIPFFAKDDEGRPQLIGNMYAGHGKIRLTKKDLAILNVYVEQASLAIQNEKLYHLEHERAAVTQALASKNEELFRVEQARASTAVTLVHMAAFGAQLQHKISGHVGLAKSKLHEYIDHREQSGSEEDLSELKYILGRLQRASEFIKQMTPIAGTKGPRIISHCINEAILEANLPEGIEVNRGEGLEELPEVEADDNLKDVFLNVIDNAAQAMHGKGLVSIEGELVDQSLVEVTISDAGPGIPPEILDKIFKVFVSTKENAGGNGIGLRWASIYLEGIGGRINVKSSIGNGAKFIITLPVSRKVSGESVPPV